MDVELVLRAVRDMAGAGCGPPGANSAPRAPMLAAAAGLPPVALPAGRRSGHGHAAS